MVAESSHSWARETEIGAWAGRGQSNGGVVPQRARVAPRSGEQRGSDPLHPVVTHMVLMGTDHWHSRGHKHCDHGHCDDSHCSHGHRAHGAQLTSTEVINTMVISTVVVDTAVIGTVVSRTSVKNTACMHIAITHSSQGHFC